MPQSLLYFSCGEDCSIDMKLCLIAIPLFSEMWGAYNYCLLSYIMSNPGCDNTLSKSNNIGNNGSIIFLDAI